MTSSPAPVTDLMPLLHFTLADLEANRGGRLSPGQQVRLKQLQTRLVFIGAAVFIGLAFLATVFLFVGQTGGAAILSLTGAGLTGINALAIGLFARQWLRLSADLRTDGVVTISGTLERILRPTGRVHHYILRVSGEEVVVNKDTFKVFQHDAPYHLYRTRHSRILLSAEPGFRR